MRKPLWIAMIVALSAPPVGAAEPPGPGEGGRGRRPGGMPGGPGGGMRGAFGGRMAGALGGIFDALTRTDIFDAARKTLDLADKAKTGVDVLDAQYADELQAAVAELRTKMSKEYVAKILELLPDEQKPKYEAVAKALAEREEAIAAAQKELKPVLDKVKTSQGADKAQRDDRRPRFGLPGGTSTSKVDILRTHFVLTEDQQDALDTAQREQFGAMRDRMQGLFPGPRDAGGQRDPNAFRQIGQAMRQVRDEVDEQVAKGMADLLTDAQKKDYAPACAAIDVCKKKTKDAEDACRKKIVEAVGEEKADALLGPPPGKPAEPKKATAF